MALLRLATEGRAILCGLNAAEQEILRCHRWRIHGDLVESAVVFLSVAPEGLVLAKDGRLFIPAGQELLNLHEELDLRWQDMVDGSHVVLAVTGRQLPSPDKIRSLLARPVKPPAPPKVDPMQDTLFTELLPDVRNKRHSKA